MPTPPPRSAASWKRRASIREMRLGTATVALTPRQRRHSVIAQFSSMIDLGLFAPDWLLALGLALTSGRRFGLTVPSGATAAGEESAS